MEHPTSPATSGQDLVDPAQVLISDLHRAIAAGWRIEHQISATDAILVYPNSPRHVLHALVCLFTIGLWLPFWLAMTAFCRDHRLSVTVDPAGHIVRTEL